MKRKSIRTRGKFGLSRYFQEMKKGDRVAVVQERAVEARFPKRLQGRTGTVQGQRGRSILVEINDQAKPKQFLIAPVHLKKLQ